jgi:hypothetical protein
MNKIAKLEQEIADLQAQLTNLKSGLPVKGQKYWSIEGEGDISSSTYHSDSIDERYLAFGNVFLTKKEAIKERDYFQFERGVRRKAKELNGDWVPDWNDSKQEKFYINVQVVSCLTFPMSPIRGAYFKSYELAKEALNYFGAEKFINYAKGLPL